MRPLCCNVVFAVTLALLSHNAPVRAAQGIVKLVIRSCRSKASFLERWHGCCKNTSLHKKWQFFPRQFVRVTCRVFHDIRLWRFICEIIYSSGIYLTWELPCWTDCVRSWFYPWRYRMVFDLRVKWCLTTFFCLVWAPLGYFSDMHIFYSDWMAYWKASVLNRSLAPEVESDFLVNCWG